MIRRLKRDQEDKKQAGSKATKSRLLKLHGPKVKPQHRSTRTSANTTESSKTTGDVDITNDITTPEVEIDASSSPSTPKQIYLLNKTGRYLWKHSYTISLFFVMVLTLSEVYNIAMIPFKYYSSSVKEVDLNVKRASRASSTSSSSILSSTILSSLNTITTIAPNKPYSTKVTATAIIGKGIQTAQSINTLPNNNKNGNNLRSNSDISIYNNNINSNSSPYSGIISTSNNKASNTINIVYNTKPIIKQKSATTITNVKTSTTTDSSSKITSKTSLWKNMWNRFTAKTKPIDNNEKIKKIKTFHIIPTMTPAITMITTPFSNDTSSINTNMMKTSTSYVIKSTDTTKEVSSSAFSNTNHKNNIELPHSFGHYADLIAPLDTSDTVFFWKVHLSGATIAERIFGKCLNLIQSSEYYTATHPTIGNSLNSSSASDENNMELQVVSIQNESYYNIDLTTLQGIRHAKEIGLFSTTAKNKQSNVLPKLDVLYSPLIHEVGETLFNPKNRGRCITILRHPIERAIGLFFYLQTHQGTQDALFHPNLEHMTLEEYSVSASIENNWLTRFLVHKRGGKLTLDDVELAKEILSRKCIIGFMSQLQDSLLRFRYFFGWDSTIINQQQQENDVNSCQINILKEGDTRHFNPLIQEDSKAYRSLVMHNYYDMILYEYALELYEIQSTTMFKDLYNNI